MARANAVSSHKHVQLLVQRSMAAYSQGFQTDAHVLRLLAKPVNRLAAGHRQGRASQLAPSCTLATPRITQHRQQQQRHLQTQQIPQAPNGSRSWRPTSKGPWEQDVRPFLGHSEPRVDAPAHAAPIVICPGFGNEANDYIAPASCPELGIVSRLEERGFMVEVLDIQRRDWARVLRSLLTKAYWSRSCTVDPAYGWFLAKVKAAIDSARLKHGSDEVMLLAHSAGGWLARAFLADERYFDDGEAHAAGTAHNRAVRSLVSLGSPHVAAPLHARDMTGGALTWVNNNWPDAHFADQGVKYACIAGCSVRGNMRAHRRALSRYSASAYSQVCGAGHLVEGDSVVPNRSAFLKGADNVLLDGVFHSMGKIGVQEPASRPWYGSDEVIDAWAGHLL